MIAKKCQTPSGHAIFCDDVRFETSGKQIYVGVYGNEMLIPHDFPARLRSIAVVANFSERPNESRHDVQFIVTYSGIEKPLAEMSVSRSELEAVMVPPLEPDDDEPYDPVMGLGTILIITDLNLPAPGRLKVVAIRGEERLLLGRLKIGKGSASQFPFPAQTES